MHTCLGVDDIVEYCQMLEDNGRKSGLATGKKSHRAVPRWLSSPTPTATVEIWKIKASSPRVSIKSITEIQTAQASPSLAIYSKLSAGMMTEGADCSQSAVVEQDHASEGHYVGFGSTGESILLNKQFLSSIQHAYDFALHEIGCNTVEPDSAAIGQIFSIHRVSRHHNPNIIVCVCRPEISFRVFEQDPSLFLNGFRKNRISFLKTISQIGTSVLTLFYGYLIISPCRYRPFSF